MECKNCKKEMELVKGEVTRHLDNSGEITELVIDDYWYCESCELAEDFEPDIDEDDDIYITT